MFCDKITWEICLPDKSALSDRSATPAGQPPRQVSLRDMSAPRCFNMTGRRPTRPAVLQHNRTTPDPPRNASI